MKLVCQIARLLGCAVLACVAGCATHRPTEEESMEAMMKAGTPGEHHRVLDAFIGDFEGEGSMRMDAGSDPIKISGTITREWILDGHFVGEKINGASDLGPMQGLGYLGYNNVDEQYEFVWMDSHSTGIFRGTGTWDGATKSLLTRGSMRDPATGRMRHSRGVIDVSNPDRHVYADYQKDENGREYKAFEGVFARVKK